MEHGTTNDERARAQRSRMNARLKIAFLQKNKVSHLQQIQLFMIPLERSRQYKLIANERWQKSVEAEHQNKKRHDEFYLVDLHLSLVDQQGLCYEAHHIKGCAVSSKCDHKVPDNSL